LSDGRRAGLNLTLEPQVHPAVYRGMLTTLLLLGIAALIITSTYKIMSAISDFAAKQAAFQTRIDTAIADLQGDVKSLNDQIAALQNSAGGITPEDQALLDGITAQASAVADKLDALDALTPPVAPTPTP